jgi:hypothetical protein
MGNRPDPNNYDYSVKMLIEILVREYGMTEEQAHYYILQIPMEDATKH